MNENNPLCPHCQQHAPIKLRRLEAFCAVCGGRRIPFSAKSLNLAGKPSRWGGIVARWLGFGILATGTTAAAAFGLLFNAVGGGSWGLVAAVPIMMLTLLFGGTSVLAGRKLGKHGLAKELKAQLETVLALAEHHGGTLNAAVVASTLSVSQQEADLMLTALARDDSHEVSLELDASGGVHYVFGQGGPALASSTGARFHTPQRVDGFGGAASAETQAEEEAAWQQGPPQIRKRR